MMDDAVAFLVLARRAYKVLLHYFRDTAIKRNDLPFPGTLAFHMFATALADICNGFAYQKLVILLSQKIPVNSE
jgi:hypothetical protein